MADTANVEITNDGQRNVVAVLTGTSDGTGESDVAKIDVSTLSAMGNGVAPTHMAIESLEYDIQGYTSIALEFDATTDDAIANLSGQGYLEFESPLADPQSTGSTGDVTLTSSGAVSGATYTIIIRAKKKA